MKPATLFLGVLSVALMVMFIVDAAAIDKRDKTPEKKNIKINNNISRTKNRLQTPWKKNRKNNPHALSVDEERFSTCGTANDTFQVQSISSNQHLCSGCKACIDLEGLLKGTIDRGSMFRLQVSKFFFKVFDKTFDLCALLDKVPDGPRCPIGPNHDGLRACLPLEKSLTTDISADLVITATDSAKKPLFCIKGTAMVESHCPSDVGPGSNACNH